MLAKARGQTVYFHAWGGGDRINAYIDWAGQQVASRYGVTVEHVKVSDTANVVSQIIAEKAAGKEEGGSSISSGSTARILHLSKKKVCCCP